MRAVGLEIKGDNRKREAPPPLFFLKDNQNADKQMIPCTGHSNNTRIRSSSYIYCRSVLSIKKSCVLQRLQHLLFGLQAR